MIVTRILTYIIIISVIYFFAGDIKQVIKALGYSSCILVAHDWGGAVAWSFATEYPELVDKLICMNIPNPHRMKKHMTSCFKQMKKSWYVSYSRYYSNCVEILLFLILHRSELLTLTPNTEFLRLFFPRGQNPPKP